jgi:Domain of unknown function (DUF6894)
MVRFFFHFRCVDRSVMDCEGTVLADLRAAEEEAQRIAADFVDRTSGRVHEKWRGWRIEVDDPRGRCVFVVSLDQMAYRPEAFADRPSAPPKAVVYLDTVRQSRRLAALREQTRELIRQSAILRQEQQYVRKRLDHEIGRAREVSVQSRALLEATESPGGGSTQKYAGRPERPLSEIEKQQGAQVRREG